MRKSTQDMTLQMTLQERRRMGQMERGQKLICSVRKRRTYNVVQAFSSGQPAFADLFGSLEGAMYPWLPALRIK